MKLHVFSHGHSFALLVTSVFSIAPEFLSASKGQLQSTAVYKHQKACCVLEFALVYSCLSVLSLEIED